MLSVRIQITVLIPHNKQAQTRLPLGKHFLIFLAEKEPPSFPVLLLRTSIPPYVLLHNTTQCILIIHILICLSQEIINTLRRGTVFLAYSTWIGTNTQESTRTWHKKDRNECEVGGSLLRGRMWGRSGKGFTCVKCELKLI